MTFYNHIVYLSKDLYIFSLSMMNCAIPLSSSGFSSEAKLELDYQGYERIATAAVISLVLLCPLETIVLKAEVYDFVKHRPKSKISVLSMDIHYSGRGFRDQDSIFLPCNTSLCGRMSYIKERLSMAPSDVH